MIAFSYIISLCLIIVYLYALHKLIILWIAKYNKLRLLYYLSVLIILMLIMCYTLYMKMYMLFLFLLVIIINALYYAYVKLKK